MSTLIIIRHVKCEGSCDPEDWSKGCWKQSFSHCARSSLLSKSQTPNATNSDKHKQLPFNPIFKLHLSRNHPLDFHPSLNQTFLKEDREAKEAAKRLWISITAMSHTSKENFNDFCPLSSPHLAVFWKEVVNPAQGEAAWTDIAPSVI